MVDTSLLLAISQASATFVAILAGFYTTKVLSIASEKKKLHSKIKDIDNEISWRRRTVASLTAKIDNIHKRWDEATVESFAGYLVGQLFFIIRSLRVKILNKVSKNIMRSRLQKFN